MTSHAQDINPSHPWQNNYPLNEFKFLFCQVFLFNTIRAGQMLHIALCCLEGSTMSNLVHRRRRCARIDLHDYAAWRAVRQRTGVYLCLSPCDGCKDPAGVMMWLTENIQACLRIFRRAQHLWLVRDILHRAQGVFYVFVLWPHRTHPSHPWQNNYPLNVF